jgi:hypothetical protein
MIVKTDSTPATPSTPAPPAPVNVFKTNVFKMGASKPVAPSANVFKMGGASSTKPSLGAMSGTKRPLSVTEALMQEDMERKRRRMDREGVRGWLVRALRVFVGFGYFMVLFYLSLLNTLVTCSTDMDVLSAFLTVREGLVSPEEALFTGTYQPSLPLRDAGTALSSVLP